jgi:hypothetical protein
MKTLGILWKLNYFNLVSLILVIKVVIRQILSWLLIAREGIKALFISALILILNSSG